jgi:di/tricarboxylate transporter
MELGDVLLVQGRQDDINALRSDPDFLILEDLPISRFKKRRARRAIIIFLAVLIAGGSGIVPVVVAVIAGAVLMIVARCIDLADAYQSISWPTIVLIAGMASMGIAMEQTGLASQLSKYLLGILGDFGPRVLLIALFLVTVLLSQPMSNAAAALLVAPIALSTATSLDLNPRTFIMTVALAASCSFMTPLEPACALVHSPGEYKFFDFARTGALLTLIMMLIVVAIVPILWPL